MLSLCRAGGRRDPSGRNIAFLSLLHHERDIVDDPEPLVILIREVVEVRCGSSTLGLGLTGALLLLQIPGMSTSPPRKAHDDEKCPLGSTGKDVGPG